jgi:hypothetical protein
MKTVVFILLHALRSCFRIRLALQAENLALRHQISELQRRRKRPPLNTANRSPGLVCHAPGWAGAREERAESLKMGSVGSKHSTQGSSLPVSGIRQRGKAGRRQRSARGVRGSRRKRRTP